MDKGWKRKKKFGRKRIAKSSAGRAAWPLSYMASSRGSGIGRPKVFA